MEGIKVQEGESVFDVIQEIFKHEVKMITSVQDCAELPMRRGQTLRLPDSLNHAMDKVLKVIPNQSLLCCVGVGGKGIGVLTVYLPPSLLELCQ